MVASWLSHVKGCHIVQTNWTVGDEIKEDSTLLFDEVCDYFREKFKEEVPNSINDIDEELKEFCLFSKKFKTVIKQAETDVIGMKLGNGDPKIYGVDVAFHSNGLGYGNSKENITKIIAKSLRTALCFYNVLRITNFQTVFVYFATPLMDVKEESVAKFALEKLTEIFVKRGKEIRFSLLANENFFNEIYDKLNTPDIINKSDLNELFMRSLVMMNISNKFSRKQGYKGTTQNNNQSIGNLAKNDLRKILETTTFTEDQLAILLDIDGTKKYLVLLADFHFLSMKFAESIKDDIISIH